MLMPFLFKKYIYYRISQVKGKIMSFKYLFIIESPGKRKKIQSFLGSEYKVIPTIGHIMDLPPKGLNVDIKNDFLPTYATMDGKEDIVKEIKREAAKAEMVYIGTDLDREGSMIAHCVASILPSGIPYKRVKYNAITREEIIRSIEEASDIDSDSVDSAECRRIIDRIAGYKTSFLTKQATGGISAGRVQSAGLRILSEREKEIQEFIPIEYWPIDVVLERENGERITASIKNPKSLDISNEKDANDIINILKKNKWIVSLYETKDKSVKPYPPFTTSSLYQSASSVLGWDSKRTASVAQSLYEEGHITYIRTDSTYIVSDFIDAMRLDIPNRYGQDYLPSGINVYGNKKNAQEAHEAIRVIHIEQDVVASGDNQRLYEIIWRRTLASQISDMIQLSGKAEFECDKYVFGVNGSKVVFDGWRRAWNYGNVGDTELPEFEEGEKLKLIDIKTEQKFTQPPSRYSEASFIKELEKRGIGRPSTYKTIIETLKSRDYVEVENRAFHVTDMGIRVSDFLLESDICFVDLDFTANLEDDLDKVAKHEKGKLCVLRDFWSKLQIGIDNAKKLKKDKNKTDYPCPKCDGYLEKKFSKYGEFFSCVNRTSKDNPCDYKCQVGEDGKPYEAPKFEFDESTDFVCPNCGEPLIVRSSKKNKDYQYLACKNWRDKSCQGFYSCEDGKKLEFSKKKKSYKKWGKKKKRK